MYISSYRRDFLVLERSFYDVLLCADETSLVVSESVILGVDGCDVTDTPRTYAVCETTIGAGSGWGAITVDCGVNYYGNICIGRGGVSRVSMACDAGIARLRSVAIFFIEFCVSSPN